MSKFLKISLTLVALVLAVVVLLVIRVVTLDPNDYKDWISERFEEQTGQRLSLAGDIDLTLYPWLGVGVQQVTIDTPESGDRPLLQAQSARLRVKLLPMLRQRFEIDTVRLQGVSLNLVVDEAGVGNWMAPGVGSGVEESPDIDTGAAGVPLTNFIIGGVDVSDFNLRYEDRRNGSIYQVNDLTFSVGELVYGAPVELAMTLNASTNQPELTAGVTLSGTVNYDLDNDRYQLAPLDLQADLAGDTLPGSGATVELSTAVDVDLGDDTLTLSPLSLTGLGASLEGNLEGQAISTSRPVYQGGLRLAGSDLAQLFRAAGVAELADRLAELDDREFSMDVGLTYDGSSSGGLEVPSLTASLLGANLEGNLQVSGVNGDSPQARGQLSATGPDLPLVVEVLGQLSGGADALLTQVSRELRQAADRQFNVDIQFDADTSAGTVNLPRLEARLIGARLSGDLQATRVDTETPQLAGNLDAEGPDLPLLMRLGGLFQGGSESAIYQLAANLGENDDRAFRVNTRFTADLEQGDIEVPVLSAQALGWQVDGEIDASGMSGRNGRINGNLAVVSSDPAPLLAALEQGELAEVVDRVDVNVEVSGTRNDLVVSPLRAELVVAGPRIPGSPVTLAMASESRINLDNESLSVESFSVSGLGLDASGTVDVERLFDNPAYRGEVELAEFNLRSFLQQLNQPVPPTADPAVLQLVGLATRFEGSTNHINLDGLTLVLDETTLLGRVSVNSFTELGGEFDINIDRLDADRYLAPETDQQTPASGDSSGQLPVEQLRDLTLLGELQIGELKVSGLQVQGLSLTVNATDGELNLAPLAAELYQGSFEGAAAMSVTGAEPQMHLEVALSGVDLEPLLSDLLDATYLTGRGNVQLNLSGTGDNTAALKRTLNGTGRLDIEDGVLSGVDVAAVLRQLETMIRSRQAGTLQRGTETDFDSFTGSMAIVDGVISSNDMLIQSPGFRVTGRGTLLNLADDSINFNLLTEVDQSTATLETQEYDIGGYSLPIACTGSLEQPRCLPDAGEILRARVQRAVQDRVLDLLNRSTGTDQDEPTTLDTDTTQETPEQQAPSEPEEEPADLREQLINRTLDRIFN